MVRLGIIGLGHWGPNILRNYFDMDGVQVTAYCDGDDACLARIRGRFPGPLAFKGPDEILRRDLIDAVVISTPTRTHFDLARKALARGLHVFVEKPLATSSTECQELISIAGQKNLVLFVGHIFLYNTGVLKLKELIDSGELGNIYYISSSRLNLGPVRRDVNVLWDLAPHDIYIALHLLQDEPVSVNCQGIGYLNNELHDVCVLTIRFRKGFIAIVHTSWLDPSKVRRITVVGDQKMAVFDDLQPSDKIKIFDKGVEKLRHDDGSFAEFRFSYRYGDTFCPLLEMEEPLKAECEHFIECVNANLTPRTDGENGLMVVRILEAATLSLNNGGGNVDLPLVGKAHVRALSG